ncbi:C-type lectin domain family 4 member E-like [Crotalus tigris]|uniref:C-type lectin domain family 4 member E-like n=1 Tax=Crotalus tigris TaxID=88082 RepID=UPI00192F51B6|nr:C-type lectin domain family 4 member E-like [Crotalus tigris]
MYGNTLSREADLPCKVWRSLPPEPAEQSGLSNEDYDNCSAESDYDSISLPCERKTPAKPLDPDIQAATGPSICSPAQWKKYWKRNQIGVLLILTGICFFLIVLFLLLSYTSILLELRSLNLNSTKEGCDASPAPFNFTELETNFITKLKSLEQRFDEKRNISLQKMEEQLLRIEIKLNILQNCRDISWQRFETNAYYFSDTEQNWEMAKEKCAEHDSHLVIINTKKEQDFVTRNLKSSIWLGLTDTEEEGTWRWVDGSLPVERSWRQGEPNNGGQKDEDCAVLYKEGKWNDIRCDTHVKFVCEKENVSVY